MKYFCSNCGKTTQYGIELPKFCAYCGKSFSNKPSVQAEEQKNKFLNELKLKKNTNAIDITKDILYNENPSEFIEAEEYSDNKSINFKNIKPSFKLDLYQSQKESFGSLIDNPSAPIKSENQNNVPTKTHQEILMDFQKEAGPLRSE